MTETGNEKFGATVTTVTDNASVVVKALSITEGKYSHIAVYTCVVHTLDTCKSIITEIKKLQILKAHFTELQTEMSQICCLKIPVPTRWGSILHFWTVLKSKNVLKCLAINEEMTSSKLHFGCTCKNSQS